MDLFPWLAVLKYAGPVVAIAIFFLFKDYQREIHTRERLTKLEDYQRQTLEGLVERSMTALTQSSECINYLGRIVERLMRVCPKLGGDCEAVQKPDALK